MYLNKSNVFIKMFTGIYNLCTKTYSSEVCEISGFNTATALIDKKL